MSLLDTIRYHKVFKHFIIPTIIIVLYILCFFIGNLSMGFDLNNHPVKIYIAAPLVGLLVLFIILLFIALIFTGKT